MAKKQNFVTPEAPCLYPFLNRADTKHNKNGVYRVSLVFDREDAFPKKVEAAAKKAYEEAKKDMKPKDAKKVPFFNPITPIEDDEGNETGQVKIEFKSYATYVDKKTEEVKPIRLNAFDAAGKPVRKLPRIGNGSVLSVAFRPNPSIVSGTFYYTLYMNAFQLVKLVEYAPDGSSYGFTKKDDGFDADSVNTGDSTEDYDGDFDSSDEETENSELPF